VLAILGPNGAGKSTLAACLAGLLPPRAGRRAGAQGAVAFQNPEAHFSRETVRAEIGGLGHAQDSVDRILDDWALAAVADQHPFTLSQGQKRRLSLALLAETDRWPVLVLDEPTASLDGAAEDRLGRRIRALARDGRALGVITHDMDFALSVADRAVLLNRGAVQFDGPCRALMRDAALLASAGLSPPEAAPVLDWLEAAC
jgi:energy-coupling factor transport system ATP-binding protein